MDQDIRVMVRFGATAEPGAALLIEDGAPAPPPGALDSALAVAHFAVPATAHVLGCACCLPRGPAAQALGRLFLARARGEAPLFAAVVAITHSQAGAAAVRAALEADVVTQARFRLAPDQAA